MPSNPLIVTTNGDLEVVMTRVFDAPRNLVFDAFTKPDLMKRWCGPRAWTLITCEIDLRPGGQYLYVMRRDNGKEMTMRGEYREIVRNERLVNTEGFDDPWFEGEAVTTNVFTEQSGRTTLASTTRYDSKAIRDAVLRTPMESGVGESFEKLDELFAAADVRAAAR
jgi:uncharacterized protein YndB with AHSA1/START domain